MDAVPSMLAKPANLLPLEFRGHQKIDSPVGQHLLELCDTAHNIEWEILDACRGF